MNATTATAITDATNEVPTTATDEVLATADATAELSSWEMATAILTALQQAIHKARDEHEAILAEHNQSPRAPGAGLIRDNFAVLKETEGVLDVGLSRTARSSGLTMPARYRPSVDVG